MMRVTGCISDSISREFCSRKEFAICWSAADTTPKWRPLTRFPDKIRSRETTVREGRWSDSSSASFVYRFGHKTEKRLSLNSFLERPNLQSSTQNILLSNVLVLLCLFVSLNAWTGSLRGLRLLFCCFCLSLGNRRFEVAFHDSLRQTLTMEFCNLLWRKGWSLWWN